MNKVYIALCVDSVICEGYDEFETFNSLKIFTSKDKAHDWIMSLEGIRDMTLICNSYYQFNSNGKLVSYYNIFEEEVN